VAETKFLCTVCRNVFSEHRASVNPLDPEEDQILCPRCGSNRIELDYFDPDEPVENPLEPESGEDISP
jgi:DNA-directed RNA polymerase subunit RPC12/RpoP